MYRFIDALARVVKRAFASVPLVRSEADDDPPPPPLTVAHAPSPRRYVVAEGVPVAVMSVTLCV